MNDRTSSIRAPRRIAGRTAEPWEKEWHGRLVDKALDERWLEALNHLSGMRLISICAGHSVRNGRRGSPAHVNMLMTECPGAGPEADDAWHPLLLTLADGFSGLPGMEATRIELSERLTVSDGCGRDGPRVRIALSLHCPAPRRSEELTPDVRAWFEAACAALARLDHDIARRHSRRIAGPGRAEPDNGNRIPDNTH
ncbi:MAG TPA: hypothetical protein PLU72_20045 [Candidatus Ozemobacteraceae bacterium]|nr:hypothetical protein [Candidatus Ozemobacteraceae bacterium]